MGLWVMWIAVEPMRAKIFYVKKRKWFIRFFDRIKTMAVLNPSTFFRTANSPLRARVFMKASFTWPVRLTRRNTTSTLSVLADLQASELFWIALRARTDDVVIPVPCSVFTNASPVAPPFGEHAQASGLVCSS